MDDIKSVQNHARMLFDSQKLVTTDETVDTALSSSGTFDPYKAFIAHREVPINRELFFVADSFAYVMNTSSAVSVEKFDEIDAEWPFNSPNDDTDEEDIQLTLM